MTFTNLIQQAKTVLNSRQISAEAWAGQVASALVTDKGNIYLGVCIDVPCSVGFCAEHSAIAAMVTAGESKIDKIVAIGKDNFLPPCGRCREFISLIHDDNYESTQIMIAEDTVVTLKELLPHDWKSV